MRESIPSWELTYPLQKGTFESMIFLFPRGGYVSFLEGTHFNWFHRNTPRIIVVSIPFAPETNHHFHETPTLETVLFCGIFSSWGGWQFVRNKKTKSVPFQVSSVCTKRDESTDCMDPSLCGCVRQNWEIYSFEFKIASKTRWVFWVLKVKIGFPSSQNRIKTTTHWYRGFGNTHAI